MDQYLYRDMIDTFLDGQLPAEDRSLFFTALATNEELQKEFHHAVIIRTATYRNGQALQPPQALTSAILSAAATKPTPNHQRPRGLDAKLLRIAALTASAAVVGFVIGRISGPHYYSPSSTQLASVTTVESEPPQPPLLSERPSATTIPTTSRIHAPLVDIRHTVPLQNATTNEDIATDTLFSPPMDLPNINYESQQIHPHPVALTNHAMEQPKAIQKSPESTVTQTEWIVSLRQTMPITMRQQRLVAPLSSSPLNNTIVAVEFRQQNVSILAQTGYEQFPIYEVTTAGDGAPRYTLRQVLWWIGGGMRVYTPPADEGLFRTLRPMAGIVLGTSQYGMLGRAELGFVWEPMQHIGVHCLLEGMVHSHGISTNWEHAEKLSASVGLALRF